MTKPPALKTVHLRLPASTQDLAALELGTVVYLTGPVYTAREGVYKRAVEDGIGLPAPPEEIGFVNFHCSPAQGSTPTAVRPSVRSPPPPPSASPSGSMAGSSFPAATS